MKLNDGAVSDAGLPRPGTGTTELGEIDKMSVVFRALAVLPVAKRCLAAGIAAELRAQHRDYDQPEQFPRWPRRHCLQRGAPIAASVTLGFAARVDLAIGLAPLLCCREQLEATSEPRGGGYRVFRDWPAFGHYPCRAPFTAIPREPGVNNGYVTAQRRQLWLRNRSGLPMPLSNAERQRRFREKRNALAGEAARTRNVSLDLLVAAREKRGVITARERRVAVQRLLKGIDPETDSALLKWLRAWSPPGAGKTKR